MATPPGKPDVLPVSKLCTGSSRFLDIQGVSNAPTMGLDCHRSLEGGTMNITIRMIRGVAWMIIAMLVISPGISAQDFDQVEQIDRFSSEELDQMLAPIALYPDSLVAQMLMASTYPLEIVQAERWLKQNPSLTGTALNDALKKKPWDPSIKSLCHFPDLLFAMSDKLDQTRKLGDAFLSQEDEVMATIQALRRKAEKQGNLKTTEEQNVVHDADVIRIEPAHRQVVYVPVYDPLYVYGPWWYPAFLPYYWYYPARIRIAGGHILFGPRFFFKIDLFSWSWFDWHRHHIYIDVQKARRFHKFRTRYDSHRYFWQHNPAHRKGVVYRKGSVRERYHQKPPRRSPQGSILRGYMTKVQKKVVKPSRNHVKYRKKPDVPRVSRERDRIQRPHTRRKTAKAPKRSPERKKLQISDNRTSIFSKGGNGKLSSKIRERVIQNRKGKKTSRRITTDTRRQNGDVMRHSGRPLKGGRGAGRIAEGFFR
jgi:hypothetical protein